MMTELAKQLTSIESIKSYLIVLALVASVFLWMRGMGALFAKMAGWKNLVRQFPAPENERPGEIFKNTTGWIGSSEFERCFTLQLLQEGLLVRPSFAKRSPILISWMNFNEVQVSEGLFLGHEQNLLLKVAGEKKVEFSLPPVVLPTIEKNIPADRFRKFKTPGSIGEVLKERWKNRKT